MLIYFAVFIISGFFLYYARRDYLAYVEYKELYLTDNTVYNIRRRNDYYLKYVFFLVIAILVLGLFTGLRAPSVGTDLSYTYFPNFMKVLSGEKSDYESGFNYLIRFIQLFSSDPQSLTLTTSFIFVTLLFIISTKYSKNYLMSLVVALLSTIYFMSLNNIRQSIACIIMVAAYPKIVQNKPIQFIIMMLIAMLFHTTCLIMLPVYIFINVKFFRKYFILTMLFMIIITPILANIFISMMDKTKYAYFIHSEFNTGRTNYGNIIFGFILFMLSFLLLYRERNTNKESYTLLVIQFFAFFVSLLSHYIPASEMVSRTTYYFMFYQLLLIPYLIRREPSSIGKSIITGTYIVSYGLYMVYYIVIMGYHQALPYSLCF